MSGAERDRSRRSQPFEQERAEARRGSSGASHALQRAAGNQAAIALLSGKTPLAPASRAELESTFEVDLAGVRLHSGAEADQEVRAEGTVAFTRGDDVYLGSRVQGDPRVLAHELVHVIQQAQPGERASTGALEAEAAAVAAGRADAVVSGATFGTVQTLWPFDDPEEEEKKRQQRHDEEAETAVKNLGVLQSTDAWKRYVDDPLVGGWLRAHPTALDPGHQNKQFWDWIANPRNRPSVPPPAPKAQAPSAEPKPSVSAGRAIWEMQRRAEKTAFSTWSPEERAAWARAQVDEERRKFVESMTPKHGSPEEALWTLGEMSGLHSGLRAATGETEWSRPLTGGERFSEGVLGAAQATQATLGVATGLPEFGAVAEVEGGAAVLEGTVGQELTGEQALLRGGSSQEGLLMREAEAAAPAQAAEPQVGEGIAQAGQVEKGAAAEVKPTTAEPAATSEATTASTAAEKGEPPAAEKPADPIEKAFAETEGELDVRKNPPQAETISPQSRAPSLSSQSQEEVLGEYEQLANEKLPTVIDDVLENQRPTALRKRLATLEDRFTKLMEEVGDAPELTAAQRKEAEAILTEARKLARKDFGNVQSAVWRRLRADPDLLKLEQQLRAGGDVAPGGRALQVATKPAGGTASAEKSFESLGIEHRVRLSDDPWLYNARSNLIITDAPQNEQYLEAIRREGIWPTTRTEEFVTRHGLSSQPFDFAPSHRPLTSVP